MSEITISDEAREAALNERRCDREDGFHVQQLLNSATEKLREENEQLQEALSDEQSRHANNLLNNNLQIEDLKKQLTGLREALQKIWDEDEMGYIIDEVTQECVKCGQKRRIGSVRQVIHSKECIEGWIETALSSTPEDFSKLFVSIEEFNSAKAEWKRWSEAHSEAMAANNENCKTISRLTKALQSLTLLIEKANTLGLGANSGFVVIKPEEWKEALTLAKQANPPHNERREEKP